jgi:hypothetical protein
MQVTIAGIAQAPVIQDEQYTLTIPSTPATCTDNSINFSVVTGCTNIWSITFRSDLNYTQSDFASGFLEIGVKDNPTLAQITSEIVSLFNTYLADGTAGFEGATYGTITSSSPGSISFDDSNYYNYEYSWQDTGTGITYNETQIGIANYCKKCFTDGSAFPYRFIDNGCSVYFSDGLGINGVYCLTPEDPAENRYFPGNPWWQFLDNRALGTILYETEGTSCSGPETPIRYDVIFMQIYQDGSGNYWMLLGAEIRGGDTPLYGILFGNSDNTQPNYPLTQIELNTLENNPLICVPYGGGLYTSVTPGGTAFAELVP